MTEPEVNHGADETKAEIYEALAEINRCFVQIANALYRLEAKGVLDDEYPFDQEMVLKEVAARINCVVLATVNERELEDRKHYGKVRENMARRKRKGTG